jgi:hypothetical protein
VQAGQVAVGRLADVEAQAAALSPDICAIILLLDGRVSVGGPADISDLLATDYLAEVDPDVVEAFLRNVT